MAFRHTRTDDPHNTADHSRTRLLERVLVRHAAEGFDVLELRRQMGKSGYVPTEHRWEDDGEGEELTDADGAVLLIAGTPPADLAVELIDTARQYVEETGKHGNYRIVAFRNVEDDDGGEDQQKAFSFLLPATMFGAGADASGGTESREHHDSLMAANQQLQRQNDVLFRMLMEVVRQYPVVLGKSTELMEQLGDQLGGGRKQDLEQILAILSFEAQRDQQWMEHDRAKQRAGHKADLMGKTFEVAGPDLMTLVRKIVEAVVTGGGNPQAGATPPSEGRTSAETASSSRGTGSSRGRDAEPRPKTKSPPTTEPDETPRGPLARRLHDALSKVPEGGIDKAKALLDADEWALIQAARAAEDDEEFAAIVTKLQEAWTAKGEAATQALMKDLIDALGMPATMTLGKLIQEVRGY